MLDSRQQFHILLEKRVSGEFLANSNDRHHAAVAVDEQRHEDRTPQVGEQRHHLLSTFRLLPPSILFAQ